jgi:hypothetical protein
MKNMPHALGSALLTLAALYVSPLVQARDTAQQAAHPTYKGFALPPSKDEPRLAPEQLKAKYRSCPNGWYKGPQNGKTSYTQDAYLWVVTPAFAKRFCMPMEFVHEGLKGAEAVAFRIVRKTDEISCGLGGNDQNCSGELAFRVELYMDSQVKLPKEREGRFYQVPSKPSNMLISATQVELAKMRELRKNDPLDALNAIFKTGQIGLSGYKDGKVAWPLLPLYPETFYAHLFEGIDYYAFDGPADRSFSNPRMRPLGLTDFRIDFKRLDQKDRHSLEGTAETEFAHMIFLPREFSQLMAEIDMKQGLNIQSVINQVLKK